MIMEHHSLIAPIWQTRTPRMVHRSIKPTRGTGRQRVTAILKVALGFQIAGRAPAGGDPRSPMNWLSTQKSGGRLQSGVKAIF
jgi:hypothetical protein